MATSCNPLAPHAAEKNKPSKLKGSELHIRLLENRTYLRFQPRDGKHDFQAYLRE